MKNIYTILLGILISSHSFAEDFIIQESAENTYNYISSYEIAISSPPDVVWKNLENLKSWMYGFELSHQSGSKGEVGEVLRLYPNQQFYIQVTGKVENKLLTIANLPSTFNGENSTGVGVISLVPSGSETLVQLTMSRRYEWVGEGENAMKAKRESKEFQGSTAQMWGNFLNKLKEISEKT
jgi:hypothetical protein